MIQINDKYKIEPGTLDYTLYVTEEGMGKDGQPKLVTSSIGYYSSVENCLKAILKYEANISAEERLTLEEYINKLYNVFEEYINKIKEMRMK